MTRHLVIPDIQAKPGVPLNHLQWIGQYAAEKHPDVIVQIGDMYDMPSLSSYDKGKKSFEGRRYKADIWAGNCAFQLLTEPILAEMRTTRRRRNRWLPDMRFLLGNHEQRIERAIQDETILDGTIGYQDFEHPGWSLHEFLEPVWIDGICYSHFFANPLSGRPYSGQSMDARLKTIGHSFTMGHQQVFMMGRRETIKGAMNGLVAGACYLHDEEYRGPQGNREWRGIVICNEVQDGAYDIMQVSLKYLCQKYEGVDLPTFLADTERHIVV